MATWTNQAHTAKLLNAAANWKQGCLLSDGSVFSSAPLWTFENLKQLHSLFVDNPILGKQKFYDKLHVQIAGASSDVKKLAAEALWVLFLIVSETVLGVEKKRERIAGVWNFSGEELPSSENLDDDVLRGLANPGIAFLTKIWMEFGFILTILVRWKSTPAADRSRLLQDSPWDFCEWVAETEGADVRAFRHILLFLCYPTYFERICSKSHKKEIYSTFASELSRGDDPYRANPTLCSLDRSIFQIRAVLIKELQTENLDFYLPPLRARWLTEEEEAETDTKTAKIVEERTIGSAPRYWVEKTIVKGRLDRQEGQHKVGSALWSPQKSTDGRDIYSSMREVTPGDVIFHLTDNAAITGVSFAAEKFDDTFNGVAGTEWGERPSYRIALKGYQPLTPPLAREAFLEDEGFRNALLKVQASKNHGPISARAFVC